MDFSPLVVGTGRRSTHLHIYHSYPLRHPSSHLRLPLRLRRHPEMAQGRSPSPILRHHHPNPHILPRTFTCHSQSRLSRSHLPTLPRPLPHAR
ncbi:hypothetical protein BDY24DRAFT_395579 [Mrakia frigida]|uniref:uncharacterized protein n=1 Tax=Mrakia frigida TaxID=29902 RepID=UPI003FCC00E6